jgi:hypothetical protein
MDRIPLIIAVTLAGIALTSTIMTVFPSESNIQEEGQYPNAEQEVTKIEKDCTTSECVKTMLRECRPSEMLITFASNATELIIIDGDGLYNGERVCLLMIFLQDEPNRTTTTPADTPFESTQFQSWSCKVSFSKLSNWATRINIYEITANLISSEQCYLAAP